MFKLLVINIHLHYHFYFVELITYHSIHDKMITVQSFKSNIMINASVQIVLCTKSLSIMLALCLMFLLSYYAQNYAGIIGSSLIAVSKYGTAQFKLDYT